MDNGQQHNRFKKLVQLGNYISIVDIVASVARTRNTTSGLTSGLTSARGRRRAVVPLDVLCMPFTRPLHPLHRPHCVSDPCIRPRHPPPPPPLRLRPMYTPPAPTAALKHSPSKRRTNSTANKNFSDVEQTDIDTIIEEPGQFRRKLLLKAPRGHFSSRYYIIKHERTWETIRIILVFLLYNKSENIFYLH